MKALFFLLLLAICMPATADQYVNGYTRQDGTYVQPHFRSEPNSTRYDNYSTQGNSNPYTGQRGHESPSQNTYQQPRYNTGTGLLDNQPRRR